MATATLTPAQRDDIALCAKALENTQGVPASRAPLALAEVRVALEIALAIIGSVAEQ
jgi:hypothetical protein